MFMHQSTDLFRELLLPCLINSSFMLFHLTSLCVLVTMVTRTGSEGKTKINGGIGSSYTVTVPIQSMLKRPLPSASVTLTLLVIQHCSCISSHHIESPMLPDIKEHMTSTYSQCTGLAGNHEA